MGWWIVKSPDSAAVERGIEVLSSRATTWILYEPFAIMEVFHDHDSPVRFVARVVVSFDELTRWISNLRVSLSGSVAFQDIVCSPVQVSPPLGDTNFRFWRRL